MNVFATCQPEHQAKLAADSRTFPVFIYDPRRGSRFQERLSSEPEGRLVHEPQDGEQVDFITFARSGGRFAKHFDKDGNPSATLIAARDERLENWRLLQDLAGVK